MVASDPLGLCLAGPTGAGKTALALAFVRTSATPVEIISVDSALVYRGMDIGTAKPSAAERAAVPHHLIDILDPSERYSAAQFAADAERIAKEIRARGHLPLLVGGTMLYFKALREGIDELPEADAAERARIDEEARARGWPALHAELACVDPVTAARLAPHDAQRIQRALEVWRVSGRPLSAWHRAGAAGSAAAHAAHEAHEAHEADRTPRAARWPLVALEPVSRAWLHARIAQRFEAMLAAGFVDEVRALMARGDLNMGLPSMRCVGYRQLWTALQAASAAGSTPGPALPASFAAAGIAATRQLAKRQLTWLRSMPERHRVACDAGDALERGLNALSQAWRAATRLDERPPRT